jgi:hypothetical protein
MSKPMAFSLLLSVRKDVREDMAFIYLAKYSLFFAPHSAVGISSPFVPYPKMADPEKIGVPAPPIIRKATSRLVHSSSYHQHVEDVNYSHFAGRLGGNQLFTLTSEDPQYEQTKGRLPDAVVSSSWRDIMDLRAFRERRLWEMAIIEGIGVALQVWSSGIVGQALVSYATVLTTGPLVPISLAALVQFLTISLFTFGLGPVTGAHLNPLITMATFVVRLSSFARMVLYVVFQCVCSTESCQSFELLH